MVERQVGVPGLIVHVASEEKRLLLVRVRILGGERVPLGRGVETPGEGILPALHAAIVFLAGCIIVGVGPLRGAKRDESMLDVGRAKRV